MGAVIDCDGNKKMNVAYVSYRASTGEIVWSGTCPEDSVALQNIDGLIPLKVESPDQNAQSHYIVGGVIKAYTPEELAVKNSLQPGFIWKMPERIAVDTRQLAEAKAMKLTALAARCDALLRPLKAGYPAGEQQSWDKQETEARAFNANSSASVPLLQALATARGIAVADLAARILSKSDQFATYSGSIIGKRQRYEDLVAASTTIADVDSITWA